jgi:hypothetical protein
MIISKDRMKRVSIFPILIQYSTGILTYSNKSTERNKSDWNREGRNQLSLFAAYMILYLKDPKDSTKKLLYMKKNLWQYSRL